jgi:hypothetical protein
LPTAARIVFAANAAARWPISLGSTQRRTLGRVYASSGAEDAEVPLTPLFPPPLLLPVLRLRGAPTPTTTGTYRLLGLGGTIMADTNGIFARVGLNPNDQASD